MGYSPWGCKESNMAESHTHTHTHTHTQSCLSLIMWYILIYWDEQQAGYQKSRPRRYYLKRILNSPACPSGEKFGQITSFRSLPTLKYHFMSKNVMLIESQHFIISS